MIQGTGDTQIVLEAWIRLNLIILDRSRSLNFKEHN